MEIVRLAVGAGGHEALRLRSAAPHFAQGDRFGGDGHLTEIGLGGQRAQARFGHSSQHMAPALVGTIEKCWSVLVDFLRLHSTYQ